MKDHRFIELLNLYIDRQITAEETAELEAEIQQHPKRRDIYRRYCKIHTATKVVYESFRAGATEQPVPSGHPATIELFESRRQRTHWAYYAGGLAAAACLALVFVRYNANSPAESQALATVSRVAPVTVVAVPVPAAVPAPTTTVVPVVPVAPNLISLRNTTTTPDYSAMLVALREQDEERAIAAERWHSGRTQSLFDDSVFETRPATGSASEDRSLRRQTAQQTEFTAFQFQR